MAQIAIVSGTDHSPENCDEARKNICPSFGRLSAVDGWSVVLVGWWKGVENLHLYHNEHKHVCVCCIDNNNNDNYKQV